MLKIIMVEDDNSVAEMMKMFFSKEQWEVDIAKDGVEAVEMFKAHPDSYDIVTLDLNLPKKDGMEVAKEIRAISLSIPIIMLTARDSETDQILGLGIGADEYVTKPFSLKYDVITKHLKISKDRREVRFDDNIVEGLTPKEFDLLYTMAQKPKQVFSRDKLLELVWGYEFFGEERTVDAHIKKLRQKLEKAGPQVVQTVWGVGYKFDDSEV